MRTREEVLAAVEDAVRKRPNDIGVGSLAVLSAIMSLLLDIRDQNETIIAMGNKVETTAK